MTKKNTRKPARPPRKASKPRAVSKKSVPDIPVTAIAPTAAAKAVAAAKPSLAASRSQKADAASRAKTAAKQPAAPPPPVEPAAPQPATSELAHELSSLGDHLRLLARDSRVRRLYAYVSVIVLLATSAYWALLGARLHQLNADQVVDPYLFQDFHTFGGATFPGAHTFLLKWPLFALMALAGFTPDVYQIVTVLMVLVTVGFLAYVLRRIEPRPAVFGTACLAVSSLLLMVPAQPYAGALLPVNLAMATTRNLEYVVFIAAILLISGLNRVRSGRLVAVVVLLSTLIASDKLFGVLALGAGVLAHGWFLLIRRWREARIAGLWLLAAAAAWSLATLLLAAINAWHGVDILSGSAASPFTPINTLKELVLGLVYAASGLLTVFGANPAHGSIVVQRIPHDLLAGFGRLSIAAYLINGLLLVGSLVAAGRLLMGMRRSREPASRWGVATVLLLGAGLTSGGVFVLTDHYYPVDARYLLVCLFALVIAAAVYLRTVRLRPAYVAVSALALIAVLPVGIISALHEYHSGMDALAPRSSLTSRVSHEVQRHKVASLVGNYWDVVPVKAQGNSRVVVAPVDHCTQPRQVLSSQTWFKPMQQSSTAYLAIRDGSTAAGPDYTQPDVTPTYGGCSLARIVSTYGTPSERIPLGEYKGQSEAPDILLLLYPDGTEAAQQRQLAAARVSTAPPEPTGPAALVPLRDRAICSRGTTLQVIAHQDDDLLFMSPDLQDAVQAGRCLRTVYMTAGDSGEGVQYWGSRERGAKAAYAQMYQAGDSWHDEAQVINGQLVTVSYLDEIPQVSLVFLRLPDGNLRGEGFAAYKYESLHKLMAGSISTIHSVDNVSYSRGQLTDTLLAIMNSDLPDDIRTLGSTNQMDGDHADHHDSGLLTEEAAAAYGEPHTLAHYLGYPDKLLPVNLPDDRIESKYAVFLTYAKFDGAVCQSVYECQNTYTYGSYLARQYQPVAPPPPDK